MLSMSSFGDERCSVFSREFILGWEALIASLVFLGQNCIDPVVPIYSKVGTQ